MINIRKARDQRGDRTFATSVSFVLNQEYKTMTRGVKSHCYVEGARTLAVFSHPNHELAVFGLLQRLRPDIVYLTGGGGPKRIAETEEGLASIGLLEQARFLNYAETEFYD